MKILILPLSLDRILNMQAKIISEKTLDKYIDKGFKIISSTSLDQYLFYYNGYIDHNGQPAFNTNFDEEILNILKENNYTLYDYSFNYPAIIYTLEQQPVAKLLYENC